MRPILFALVMLVASGCSPSATTPSPSPSLTATTAPTRTATPSPAAATPSPIPLPTFVTLSAPSADVLWALVAGSHLFRSSDRGATWQERTPPAGVQIEDMAFASDREGWLVDSGPALCGPGDIAIYHTADGATTWERTLQPDPKDGSCKGGLFFADAKRGWMTLFSISAAPALWRTADGGTTWTRSSSLPDPPGFTTQPGGFTLRPGRVRVFGTTLLVAAVGRTQTGSSTYVYRSTDDGTTWRFVSKEPLDQIDVSFLSATRWLQIAPPGDSRETTDAGASWHPFTTDYQQAAPIAPQIVFADANIGYATARGAIQRTFDGGAHWSAIKTPGT
jgi:photosystem II stability/assembly factor-like uncharacterized protein